MTQILRRKCLFNAFYGRLKIRHELNYARSYVSVKVDSGLLSQLRKKTGYGLSLCREALVANENDLDKAMSWLSEQGKVRGLQKASTLQGRKTSEGLVGVMVENNHAAMVEVCCETDFVSQNATFHELVAKATATALAHRKNIVDKSLKLGCDTTHFREVLLMHKLTDMFIPGTTSTLNDTIHELIGRLGERVALRRAITMTTDTSASMGYYTHGPFTYNLDNCAMGKYSAVVVLETDKGEHSHDLAKSLAQHVVGMGPKVIYSDESGEVDKNDVLLEQQYLMNEQLTVKEFLKQNNVRIVDFLRFVCGED